MVMALTTKLLQAATGSYLIATSYYIKGDFPMGTTATGSTLRYLLPPFFPDEA